MPPTFPTGGGKPAFQFVVGGRKARLILEEVGDRVAHATLVGALQALDELVQEPERHGEGHLVVVGVAEDPVAVAGEDDLVVVLLQRPDQLFGAVGAG